MFKTNEITIKLFYIDGQKQELITTKREYHKLLNRLQSPFKTRIKVKGTDGQVLVDKPRKSILPFVRLVEGVDEKWVERGLNE